jgi:hypothetical protein
MWLIGIFYKEILHKMEFSQSHCKDLLKRTMRSSPQAWARRGGAIEQGEGEQSSPERRGTYEVVKASFSSGVSAGERRCGGR